MGYARRREMPRHVTFAQGAIVILVGCGAGCGGKEFLVAQRAEDGKDAARSEDDARSDADAAMLVPEASPDAAPDTGSEMMVAEAAADAEPDATVVDATSEPGAPVAIDLVIGSDTDDAEWLSGTDERLHYGPDDLTIEVGDDVDMGRVGLRFQLPIVAGSTIESAVLRLHRFAGPAQADDTMDVQVFDTADVPPFDDAHVHEPSGHAPGGLWSLVVTGYRLGQNGTTTTSPELSGLVQHVVDRPDYSPQAFIGFVLSPDHIADWAAFQDSASGSNAARLHVVYTPPASP